MTQDGEIQRQLADMSSRIASLEAAVRALRAPLPEKVVVAAPPLVPPVKAAPVAVSWENRIGGQLLNRVGIVAVLIGVAWFLKLAFDRDWIGPLVRVLIGLVCAAGLVVWSERFRRRGFPAFSYSLKALATSIAYLSLWAASSMFHLAPAWIIFIAMAVVTVANAVLALTQESELLAIYALSGGLATPALLSVGHGNEVFLFCYLALLNAGALWLLSRHAWRALPWAALLGTAAYYGWAVMAHNPSQLVVRVVFLALFFAGFAAVPYLRAQVSPLVFPVVNAMATWLALSDLLTAHFWVAIALGVVFLLLAMFTRAGVELGNTHLGLGLFFVTVAIPMQFHGYVVTICWLAEALVLVVLARTSPTLRAFAFVVMCVASASLLEGWVAGSTAPLTVFANTSFLTSMVAAAVFATVVVVSTGATRGFAAVAFSVAVVISVTLEIHHYWFCGASFFRALCGGYGRREARAIAAGFSYGAWWMLYGAALMTAGFVKRSAFLRWQALALLAMSIGKVFLNGVSLESQGYRVLSFLALGALLLAVSFAYQKDWLRLRG
jgi:uncharacterized membrane protein